MNLPAMTMDELILKNGAQAAPPHRGTIVIGEDDSEVSRYLELALRCHGYSVSIAGDGTGVIDHLGANNNVSAVLLDLAMPHMDGLETLRAIRRSRPALPVIMLSGSSTPSNIVTAMKGGAVDFLFKPVSYSDLETAIGRAVRTVGPSGKSAPCPENTVFWGTSAAMREIHDTVPDVAAGDIPVLILGETGTGKEALARHIHRLSLRAAHPFVKLNCAAVPSELIESELFGYEKGAFTGAVQRKAGLFEMADGGTILLDEIGDMDFRLQAKLLQVLQDGEFRRVGGRELIRVDVRVIAATHRNLERGIVENTFREDLYYRLNVCAFVLPPLRERLDDIPAFAAFLLRRYLGEDAPARLLTEELIAAFFDYSWPGNVRELENIVRKLLTLKQPTALAHELRRRTASPYRILAVMPDVKTSVHSARSLTLEDVSRSTEKAEAAAIVEALEGSKWNRKRAAARLKIDYKALLYKMKKLNISVKEEVTWPT